MGPALPLGDAGPYVAAAYLVFLALVLIYVGIMATKLARLHRDIAELAELAELREVALDPHELGRHDRDVDQHQREEDEIRGGDVLARLVERQRGHQSCGAADRRGAGAQSSSAASSLRRRLEAREESDAERVFVGAR